VFTNAKHFLYSDLLQLLAHHSLEYGVLLVLFYDKAVQKLHLSSDPLLLRSNHDE